MTLQTQLTAQQVADKIGVSVPTIWRWAKAGKFPKPRKHGQMTTRWNAKEVAEFLGETP